MGDDGWGDVTDSGGFGGGTSGGFGDTGGGGFGRPGGGRSGGGGGGFGKSADGGGFTGNTSGGIQFGSRGRDRPDGGGGGGGGGGFGDGEGGEERPPLYRPDELDLEQEEQFKIDQGINFERFNRIEVDVKGGKIEPINAFNEVIKSELLLKNIEKAGYRSMTPIQRYTIPALANGHDLVGCAQTGSGKTAAFLLPVLQTIISEPNLDSQYGQETQRPHCIVMAPTRELAKQTYVEAMKLSRDSVIKCQFIYGGIATGYLRAQISKGTHVLVSTPGRLKDFLERNWISLENLKYIILDEGDRLIDDGFVTDMRALFTNRTMPPPNQRQTMFFSATFKQAAQEIAQEFMKRDYLFITVGMVGAANEDVKQQFIQVERPQKKRELKRILLELDPSDKVIVFTQTKATADVISSFLTSSGIECTSIHGDRHQSQREQALNEFKRGTKRCLVASPVGERGLDLPKVSMVVNYDMPNELDEYIHRIGRTGRIGNTGRAISFFDPERDRRIIDDLTKALKQAQQEVPDFFNNELTFSNDDPFASNIDKENNDGGFGNTGGGAAAVEEQWD